MLNIIVNNGSTSKKYALFNKDERVYFAYYEKTPKGFLLTETVDEKDLEIEIDQEIFDTSFSHFIDSLLSKSFIKSEDDITSVTFRTVAPRKYFQEHKIIDSDFLEKLDDVFEMSPLHIKPLKESISFVSDRLPGVTKVSISDSAFHRTLLDEAKIYALPTDLTEKLELYRYGYHGISVEYVVGYLNESDSLGDKAIICHLGGGSSVTAIKDGKSIDTSMGFSPLEGLPMATRVGNADPNSLIAIMDEMNFDTLELQDFLYKNCGVSAISGLSSDTRVLLEEVNKGNKEAELAINFYVYSIKKYIGAYATLLGGLDSLIFTGKIGERSAEVRKRVCEGLKVWGGDLDLSKNKLQVSGSGKISSSESKIDVQVVRTNEVEEMNKLAQKLL